MDCETRAFEFPVGDEVICGVPPRCYRRMVAQEIRLWTLPRLLAAALANLFSAPRALALMLRRA